MAQSGPFRRITPPVIGAELAAIDAIRAAYMACNTADVPLAWEVTPGNDRGDEPTAMGHLAAAGRAAWRQIGVNDCDLWDVMGDSGESAAYVMGLYISGQLEGRFTL